MKMKGLHRYPNGVAFGGRADVAIFKSDGDPKLTDTGVPQGCLAVDYTTPALWRKTGPNLVDWVKVEDKPRSSFEFSRKGASAVSWLLLGGVIPGNTAGHVQLLNTSFIDISFSLKTKTICTFEVFTRTPLGVITIVATVSNTAVERLKVVKGIPVVMSVGDEIAVKMTTGNNDVVFTVVSY